VLAANPKERLKRAHSSEVGHLRLARKSEGQEIGIKDNSL